MRLICIGLLCLLITISWYCLNAEESGPANTVNNYYAACQNGNIEAIKNLITGPFYEKRKVLLNENLGYSKFLIQHFKDVKFNLISENIRDNERLSEVVIERKYPDGSRLQTRFIIKKNNNEIWKIYNEELLLNRKK